MAERTRTSSLKHPSTTNLRVMANVTSIMRRMPLGTPQWMPQAQTCSSLTRSKHLTRSCSIVRRPSPSGPSGWPMASVSSSCNQTACSAEAPLLAQSYLRRCSSIQLRTSGSLTRSHIRTNDGRMPIGRSPSPEGLGIMT